jgi:hypothetical protein
VVSTAEPPSSYYQPLVRAIDNNKDRILVSSYVIDVPAKRWHPKPQSNYHPVDDDGLPDDYFLHVKLGKSLVDNGIDNLPPRDDLILWNESDLQFLQDNLRVGSNCTTSIRDRIVTIIKSKWDAFAPIGVRRPVRGILFHVDTGNSPPICVPQPRYGIYEGQIMQQSVDALRHNGMVAENNSPWGFKLVLAPKPHQESCVDIKSYIWRMCVNFQKLNSVTKPFKAGIPRCADALELLNDSKGPLFAISLDADSGFHQIAVMPEAHDKLCYWAPDGRKDGYLVMPFGVLNGCTVYQSLSTRMLSHSENLNAQKGIPASSRPDAVYVLKSIIDDTLLVSNDLDCI